MIKEWCILFWGFVCISYVHTFDSFSILSRSEGGVVVQIAYNLFEIFLWRTSAARKRDEDNFPFAVSATLYKFSLN